MEVSVIGNVSRLDLCKYLSRNLGFVRLIEMSAFKSCPQRELSLYTDFSKAFDKVDPKLLLHKSSLMGFSDSAVK